MRLLLLFAALATGCGGGGGTTNAPPTVVLLLPQPLLVDPGMPATIHYVDDDPDSEALTDIYIDLDNDPTTTEDRVLVAQARLDGDGSVQEVVWDTTGVASGTFCVVAVTTDGINAPVTTYEQDAIVVNAPPTVVVVIPAGSHVMPGASFPFPYRDLDIDDEATTDLFADRDGDLATTSDQYAVSLGRPEQAGVLQQADWNTSGVASGDYFLLAVVSDGVHEPVVGSSARTVSVRGTSITVKDASGRGAASWPVTAVVPLTQGRLWSTDRFRIVDAAGATVPAQFEVLNRWWAGDNSIRHVAVHFNAAVAADASAGYRLRSDATGPAAPPRPVSVIETASAITVDTGAVRFTLDRGSFNLFDVVHVDSNADGAYAPDERIVAPGASDGPVFTGRLPGDVQRTKDRSDLTFSVEEAGPLRAVIRIGGPTLFASTTGHTHGFAVRIYAYAGRPIVKVAYQLQNSAKNVRFSWPLYFEDLSLHVRTDLDDPTLRLSPAPGDVWAGAPGHYLLQSSLADASVRASADDAVLRTAAVTAGDSSFGWADLSDDRLGMAVMVRHMAEMWPNAVEASADGDVAVRLWPRWGAQFHEGVESATGLYWLEDMQHVVKEVLFYFHGPGLADADLEGVARNFQYHPVPFVALEDHNRSRVTVDLLGLFPGGLEGTDTKRVEYTSNQLDPAHGRYNFGWQNFGGDTTRKRANTSGSWPNSAADIFASGRIDRFLEGERRMWGDLNVRPMWLDGYDHDTDFELIRPTENPYGGKSWRKFDGHGDPYLAAPYLEGTGFGGWRPRGNSHAWLYHVEEFYLASYNLWARDWYRFIAEFRKRTLFQSEVNDGDDPYFEWTSATRGEGHMLANSLQAYRVTGDEQLLDGLRNRIDWLHEKRLDPLYRIIDAESEAPFQNGYLARSLLGIYRELRDADPEHAAKAFLLYWGLVEWNHNIARWGYYVDSSQDNSGVASNGTCLSMVDAVAVFYLLSGRRDIYDDMAGYVDGGYNGGRRPYGGFPLWEGGWEGRAHEYVRQNPKEDETPPAAVDDLAARINSGKPTLEWTSPDDAERFYAVWSTLPIARTFTRSAGERNFWAANLAGTALSSWPGALESLEVEGLPAGSRVYFALVGFDAAHNLSGVSNIAVLDLP